MRNWQVFWQDKTTPMHRQNTREYYEHYAEELRVLLHGICPRRVLELGCGNGAFFDLLGFDKTEYCGVDFSTSMLGVFRAGYPDLTLICCDASRFRDETKYDLIFSNQLIQNFDRSMLHQHFANVRCMMTSESRFVCASIPWKRQRMNMLTREFVPPFRRNIFRGYLGSMKRHIRSDGIGFWYDLKDFQTVADEFDMSVEFYGSMLYLYRFHAVLRLK